MKMFIKRRLTIALSFLAFTPFCTTTAHAEELDPSRFEKTVVSSNLIQPMEMALAPDGKIFLIELAGLVKTIDPNSGKVEVVGKLEVTMAQENGLIGLELDPNFEHPIVLKSGIAVGELVKRDWYRVSAQRLAIKSPTDGVQ